MVVREGSGGNGKKGKDERELIYVHSEGGCEAFK